jgi:hypothetical protein
MNSSQIISKASVVILVCAGFLITGCAHYKEESGRKTEYNGDTGRFETSDYASSSISTSPQKKQPQPISEKDLKKTN